jgi:hypothetical protein
MLLNVQVVSFIVNFLFNMCCTIQLDSTVKYVYNASFDFSGSSLHG